MVNAKSNQTTSIIVGIVSLLVGLLLGWYLSGATNQASAQQQISRNVTPVPVATQCGTPSNLVFVPDMSFLGGSGRPRMANDVIGAYRVLNGESTYDGVLQGLKIQLTSSVRLNLSEIQIVSPEGILLGKKRLTAAERRGLAATLAITFNRPLMLTVGQEKTLRIYADTTTLEGNPLNSAIGLATQLAEYRSANLWVRIPNSVSNPPISY